MLRKTTLLFSPDAAPSAGAVAPSPAPKTGAPAPASASAGASGSQAPPSTPESFDDVYADIDAANTDDKGKKPAERAKAPEPKAKEAKAPEPKPDAKPPERPPAKPERAADLRAAYDQAKEKVKTYEGELSTLRAKVKEFEETGGSAAKSLQERLTAMEKERAELIEEVRYQNAEKDPDYKKSFMDPYNEAWSEAVSEVEQLTVTQTDGTTRRGTAGDLLALCDTPYDKLHATVREWFGEDAASDVLAQVKEVRKLANKAQKAKAELRAKGGERAKEQEERQRQFGQEIHSAWQQASEAFVKKHPKLISKEEGDNEGNALIDKATAFADSVFLNSGLEPLEKAKRSAQIRAMAISSPRLARKLKLATTRITELEADLAKFEASSPNGGLGASPGASGGDPSIEDEIDAADRRR